MRKPIIPNNRDIGKILRRQALKSKYPELSEYIDLHEVIFGISEGFRYSVGDTIKFEKDNGPEIGIILGIRPNIGERGTHDELYARSYIVLCKISDPYSESDPGYIREYFRIRYVAKSNIMKLLIPGTEQQVPGRYGPEMIKALSEFSEYCIQDCSYCPLMEAEICKGNEDTSDK